MSRITVQRHLPFVEVRLYHNGKTIVLPQILLDSGSAGTVFDIDAIVHLGMEAQPHDVIREMVGVGGGVEYVIEKTIDCIEVGQLVAGPFKIQVGALDYRIQMNGILGFDFLQQSGAWVDFRAMEIGLPQS